jgi:hypothetical protein
LFMFNPVLFVIKRITMDARAIYDAMHAQGRQHRAQLTVLPVEQVRPVTEAEAEADEHVLPSDDPDTLTLRMR